MARKRFSVEQIVAVLKQAEMGLPMVDLDTGETFIDGFTYEATDGAGVATATITVNGLTNVFEGTSLDDDLIGNRADNTISGFEGNDTLEGAEGSDMLIGGEGNDLLIGDGPLDGDIAAILAELGLA